MVICSRYDHKRSHKGRERKHQRACAQHGVPSTRDPGHQGNDNKHVQGDTEQGTQLHHSGQRLLFTIRKGDVLLLGARLKLKFPSTSLAQDNTSPRTLRMRRTPRT